MKDKIKSICVFCSSSDVIDEIYFQSAAKLGEIIGKDNYNLIHGAGKIGLMGSIPVIGAKGNLLSQIEGSMPRLSDIPPGCSFHPRCTEAMEQCSSIRPKPQNINGSQVACLLFERGQ